LAWIFRISSRPLHVGQVDHHLAVEAARAHEGGVEHVLAVRRRHDDDALVGVEAVHLDEDLVERLLALVVAAAEAGAAAPSDGVDFIQEDDAGRVLLRLAEEVADARRADADEHLDEVRAGDRAGRGRPPRRRWPWRGGSCRCRAARSGAPRGGCGRRSWRISGVLEELDDLADLSLASSTPATSPKVVFTLSAVMNRARLLPNERMFPGPPLARIWRKKKYQATSRMMTQGTIDISSWARKGSRLEYWKSLG
jgi:hypothetical protein